MMLRELFNKKMKDNQELEAPPFSRWTTFGNHLYRSSNERCDVEFVNKQLKIRKTIIDNAGNILNFPGIKKGEWMEYLKSSKSLKPIIRFRTSFEEYNDAYYIMIWEVQPDGRYWDDEDGFGGTSDIEVRLYALIDHTGCFDGPFRIYSAGIKKYI